jgi:hypothetical protein
METCFCDELNNRRNSGVGRAVGDGMAAGREDAALRWANDVDTAAAGSDCEGTLRPWLALHPLIPIRRGGRPPAAHLLSGPGRFSCLPCIIQGRSAEDCRKGDSGVQHFEDGARGATIVISGEIPFSPS